MDQSTWQARIEGPAEDIRRLGDILENAADNEGNVISTFELDDPDDMSLEIYSPSRPDAERLSATARLAMEAPGRWEITELAARDWVSESQKLQVPVDAGRFFVHGAHDAHLRDKSRINLEIEAGQAFGTGAHATTKGCLLAIDHLAERLSPRRVLDLGTGSGVLALGAKRIWPQAQVMATDIDPIATKTAAENAAKNDVSGIAFVTADGLEDPEIQAGGPYDLITANILAGPLCDMAGDISGALADHGHLVLSGLLKSQEKEVLIAYSKEGMKLERCFGEAEWQTMLLGNDCPGG